MDVVWMLATFLMCSTRMTSKSLLAEKSDVHYATQNTYSSNSATPKRRHQGERNPRTSLTVQMPDTPTPNRSFCGEVPQMPYTATTPKRPPSYLFKTPTMPHQHNGKYVASCLRAIQTTTGPTRSNAAHTNPQQKLLRPLHGACKQP